jgi:GTP-binding protein LepA
MSVETTRNFCIIAHIDHGKTTLSDRLLEFTGTIAARDAQDQLLDSMDLERERGITIKAHPVTMLYKAKDGIEYNLNLLDTPGHVDFAYEVSRSLAACEGALLIVDAAQGVEAQTVANVHLAMKQGLTIVPIINKIDLPNADIPSVKKQLEEILAIPAEEALLASAKARIGIEDILEAVVHRIPAPRQWEDDKLRALVFDSTFDVYRGVVTYVRVFSGAMEAGTMVKLMSTNRTYEIKEAGCSSRRCRAGRSWSRGGGVCDREYQDDGGHQDRRYADGQPELGVGAAAGVPGDSSDGVQRDLPDQYGGFRAFEAGDGEAADQ